MVIVLCVVEFKFFRPEIMISLDVKVLHNYTFYMVISTRSLKDKQSLPKPIHHQQEAAHVADMFWFPPMQMHHAGFWVGQQSNQ
jgi:hypothetical protein